MRASERGVRTPAAAAAAAAVVLASFLRRRRPYVLLRDGGHGESVGIPLDPLQQPAASRPPSLLPSVGPRPGLYPEHERERGRCLSAATDCKVLKSEDRRIDTTYIYYSHCFSQHLELAVGPITRIKQFH